MKISRRNRNGSNLSWRFNGINLPPSNGSATIGHGYITFQIKPKSGYAIGDIIPNYANIYFDFNPAIVTNVCTTEFVATLSNPNFAFNNLNYFPNPVKNSLNFNLPHGEAVSVIRIHNIAGQTVIDRKLSTPAINLEPLKAGAYIITVTTNKGTSYSSKFIKE